MGIISTIAASLVLSAIVSDVKPDGHVAQAFSNADTVAEKAVTLVGSPLVLIADGLDSGVNGAIAGGKAVGKGAVAAKDGIVAAGNYSADKIEDGFEASERGLESAGKSIKSGAIKAKDATVAGAVYAGQKTKQGANYVLQKVGDGFGWSVGKIADGLRSVDKALD